MFIFENLTSIYPIFSLIFSLVLMFGLYYFGEIICYNEKINFLISSISKIKYQKIILACNFLMIVIFPIVLFINNSKYILNFISIAIFILGLIKINIFLNKKKFKKNFFLKQDLDYYIFFVIVLGIFLINFSPVNHVDSLDYHLWGAKYIFETGRLPTSLESFTNLLVSSGEALYSLGFFFGAEQFGNFIQFSGVISLIGIFNKLTKKKYFLLLLILSSPMIIFLVSSPKPQFFHLSSNVFLFVLFFINFKLLLEKNYDALTITILTNIFLINSINSKFSFILSSFIIYILLSFVSYKKNFFIIMFFINTTFITIFYFGFIYWKYSIWGGNFINYIINPLPIHIDGVQLFYNYLINYNNLSKGGSDLVQLIFPKNIGQYTEAIGIGIFIFLYFFKQKNSNYKYFIFIFLFFVLINFFFGQASSRFYFEIYVWMILLLASSKHLKISKPFKLFFYIQFIATTGAIWFGVLSMSYGFLSSDLRNKVMESTANGYSLYKWSNNHFKNKNVRVLSLHRATGLGQGHLLATSFSNFLIIPSDKIDQFHIKKYLINSSIPTYLLSYGNRKDFGIFAKCIDYLYLSKKKVGKHVGRNPFNKGGYYDGYIFKLKDFNKTNCLNHN
jgi:hypothetical protein